MTDRGARTALSIRTLAIAAGLAAAAVCAPLWASVVERGFMPLADGIQLNYVLTRPDGPGPFPVALTYGPYSEGYVTTSALPHYDMATWLAEGYAHLSVSFRGTGCSGGTFQPFNAEQWGGDGAEVVEWAARQPWSSGSVGMYGLSFPGTSQLATAAFSQSGHLKAIAPWATFPDLYRDITYPGGVFDSFAPLWAVAGRAFVGLAGGGLAIEPAPECEINPLLYLGANGAEANNVIIHPYFDEFYSRQPERYLDRIQVPVYGCVAWQDTTIYSRSFTMFRSRLNRGTTWLIGNNGAHGNCARASGPVPPEGAAPLLKFFERYVKAIDNGWEQTPHLVIAHEVDTDNRAGWTTAFATWDDLDRQIEPLGLYLHTGGLMNLTAPTADEAPQIYDFPLPTVNTPADWMGQSPYGNPSVPGASIQYTTPALAADAEFLGSGSVNLWLSSTTADTDVQVMLSEIRPDGQELFVQNGWLRWSRRKVDPARSTVLFPLQTHVEADAQPLNAGEAVLGRVELQPFSHVFRAGSAIRLSVDTPGKWFVPLSTPGSNSVHHSPAMPSQLVLGWRRTGVAQGPLPACGSLLNQPCRPNAVPVPEGQMALNTGELQSGSGRLVGATGRTALLVLLLFGMVRKLNRRAMRIAWRRKAMDARMLWMSRAVAALAVGLLAACGQSAQNSGSQQSPGLPLGPISCPAGGDVATAADIVPELLLDEATLKSYEEHMVNLGPRFTGSPAHKQWHEFMVSQLTATGLSVVREPIALEWWLHRKYSLKLVENGAEIDVPVASYYPYSGSTPDGGIVAKVADAGMGLPADFGAGDFAGKIAFYEEDMLPTNASIFYVAATYVHDPDMTLTPAYDYKRAALSFLTPQELTSLTFASNAGAVGAIVSYEASADNAAGQYTPFLTNPGASQGVPALYVDRATGDMLKAKIAAGATVRLELAVDKHPGDFTEDIIATLPGTTDEVIIFNTHTDGTSASQENGTIGLLSLARYFASLPANCRQRTMVFALTPGHFHNGFGGDTEHFIANHPEIIAKSVGSVTLEHLGQTEWVDDVTGFHPTGMFEPGAFFGSTSPIQALMVNAVIAEDLRRVFVLRPYGVIYFGVGSPLNARGVPNAAYITGPNVMLSFANNQHIDKMDYARMAAEIRTAARIAASIDATPAETLCAGMPPSAPGRETGCPGS